MLDPYRELLLRLREDRAAWSELDCTAGEPDASARKRLGVLLCLLCDLRPADHELIRYLAQQVREEAATEWGFTRNTELVVHLLARLRDPADLPLLGSLKTASFDTECGIDLEYLVYLDPPAVQDFLDREAPDLAEELSEQPERFGPETLELWWERQQGEFPADPQAMPIHSRISDALALGTNEEASRLVDQWLSEAPEDGERLRTAIYYRKELGQLSAAIDAARRRLSLLGDPWEAGSARLALANLLVETSALAEAQQELERLSDELERNAGWREVGLGRSILHALWTFAAAGAPMLPGAAEWALDRAEHLRMLGVGAPLVALEEGIRAAAACGDVERERRYRELAAAERERIHGTG